MRDAESLLDQVVSFTGPKVEDTHISDILGIIDRELIFEASEAILEGSAEKCMEIVDRIYRYGYDIREFHRVLMDQFRNLLVSLVAPGNDLIDLTDRDREEIDRQAHMAGLEKLQQALNLLIVREPDLKLTSHPRLVLETIMIKLCRLGDVLSFDELLKKIDILEKKLTALPNKEGSAGFLSDPGSDWKVEESAGPSSEMSTEKPEGQNWNDLLDHLASKNGAMANVLKEWRFLRLKGETLEILRGDNPFSSSYLDEPERLNKFIEYCREFFKRDLKIKIVDDKKKDERPVPPETEKVNFEKKEHSDLPKTVQDILQIFQGEIKEEVSIKKENSKESV